MRLFDDARGIDASRVLGTQQGDIVGTLAMSGIVGVVNPKAQLWPDEHGQQSGGGALQCCRRTMRTLMCRMQN